MSGAEFAVDGLPQVQALLEGLPGYIRNEVLKEAIRPAGEMVRDAIKSRAHFDRGYSTGKLAASIEFRATQIAGQPSGVVVPSRKKGFGGQHAHLLEYGVKPHMEPFRKGGRPVIRHPGMAAEPFFWAAAESSSEPALDAMEKIAGDRVEAYWAKVASTSGGSTSDGAAGFTPEEGGGE